MATALKDKLVTLEDLKSLYDAVDSRLGGGRREYGGE